MRANPLGQVKPGSVHDGDTLRVVRGQEELKVRLCPLGYPKGYPKGLAPGGASRFAYGIDAPEIKQPLGIESRDYLRSVCPKGCYTLVLKDKLRKWY